MKFIGNGGESQGCHLIDNFSEWVFKEAQDTIYSLEKGETEKSIIYRIDLNSVLAAGLLYYHKILNPKNLKDFSMLNEKDIQLDYDVFMKET